MQISTWVSSQKLRLISAAVRVNQQFLCCWRLRNQHELDAIVEELSALLPKEQLYRLYEQATREPYSFLFVYYQRFEERFALEKDADGSGAQLPGPKISPAPQALSARTFWISKSVLSVAPAGCAPAFSDHSAVAASANSISITRFSCGGSIFPQRRMPTMVGRSSTSA